MKKDVMMYLHSTIATCEEAGCESETHSMEMTLPANFYQKEDTIYIFYKEEDPETHAITQCRLEITGKKMTIVRKGAASSQMELDVGKTTHSDYYTPFGKLELQIDTDALQSNLTDTSFRLLASYSLSSNGALMSKHTLQVRLSEQ